MKAEATVRLQFQSERQLKSLVAALTPEVQRQVGTRSKASIAADGLNLILNVKAEDTAALRAALNAYLRWLSSTMNILEVAEQKS